MFIVSASMLRQPQGLSEHTGFGDYLSAAPQAVGASAAPQAAGTSAAPQAVGLSPAPQAEETSSSLFFHPERSDNAIFVTSIPILQTFYPVHNYIVAKGQTEKKYAQIYNLVTFL